MELMDHQLNAVELLGNGKVLHGSVGTGKTLVALAYYMKKEAPRHIYVFTTAKVRDSLMWEGAAAKFGIGDVDYATVAGMINVDSWNNIGKYTDIEDAFIIFDEQRLVGHGVWVKSFIKMAKKNHWIMLSATPGDTYLDYAPLFIANGFYKNITDFKLRHVMYEPFLKYPKIRGYLDERKLEILRNDILVEMPYLKDTTFNLNYLNVSYDVPLVKDLVKRRWHVYEDRPIKDAPELFRLMRQVVNTDPSRLETVRCLMKIHPRLVIFYNYNYELAILRTLSDEVEVAEWNGHQKDPIPDGDRWVYLVQYVAGAEGWNCTSTDSMILYSLTFSYKNFIQAQGRIDRLDNIYKTLYCYVLMSNSKIDTSVKTALDHKKSFNWKSFDVEKEVLGGTSKE